MNEKPINEEEYERIELPENIQKVFTGLLSSVGQIVIDSRLRTGELTSEEFVMKTHDKVELKLIAIHRLKREKIND